MKNYGLVLLFVSLTPCFAQEPVTKECQEDANRRERMAELENLIVDLINRGKLDAVEAAVKEIAEKQINEIYKMIQNGDAAAVELAIAKGFDVNSKNSSGFTPLTTALIEYKRGAIFLEEENASVKEVVDLLLKSGANPNTPYVWVEAAESAVPVEIGISSCDETMVQMLLKAGADISLVKDMRKSVSHCSEQQKTNIFVLLLEHRKS